VIPKEFFDEKSLMRMHPIDMVAKLRGLCIQAVRKLDELSMAHFALHMVDDYEILVSKKEKEIIELRQVR
jgi:hypothetical protein